MNTSGAGNLPHQWIDSRFDSGNPHLTFQPSSPVENVALIAPKTTDIVRFAPSHTPHGMQLDPTQGALNRLRGPALKAAYYSAAFIVRSVAAGLLDIDPEELDISTVRRVERPIGHFVGEIVISDHLANGAGFAGQVHSRWQELLDSIIHAVPGDTSFAGGLISPAHRRAATPRVQIV